MKLLLITAALVASAPTTPDTFAVPCSGETFRTSVRAGKVTTEKFNLLDQIFVFSENSVVALRAMPLRKEFENLCELGSTGKEMKFSPNNIRVHWVSPSDWDTKTSCEFEFSRSEAVAIMRTNFEWSDTHNSETEWRMSCTPTQVPIFDSEER